MTTLDSNPLGTNTTNGTTSPIDSISVGTKTSKPTQLTSTTESTKQNGKEKLPGDSDPYSSSLESSSENSYSLNDINYGKPNKKKRDKEKSVGKTGKMHLQTHHQETILVRLTIMITDKNNIRGRSIGKMTREVMRTFNDKVSDNSI